MTDGLERHDVHQSLLRTPLFAGVDFGILIVELSLGVAVLFVGGFGVGAILPALIVIVAVHIPMRKLIAVDPAMIAIIPAALRYKRFYPPSPRLRETTKKTRPPRSIRTEI